MATPDPIAIIGTGCRFPGSSSSPSKLWDLLRNPRNVATKVPEDRFNIDVFHHPDGSHRGTTNVEESYFLSDDISRFDAPFFNISASEAGNIDPQQRLLLETVYESLEAAGLPMHTLQGSSTGVFCGVMNDDWSQLLAMDGKAIPHYSATGIARTNLANRVSYFFNWHGPSFTIDTACSSSLVALHQAVYSLRAGESALAVVTGANLIFSPNMYISASNMHMLSPTGRCRMWDDQADGYARGEGVASIVLKRLSDAIADGDPIECVIRATGTNQDGRTMGLTMPSSDAQLQLIKATYAAAGLDPASRPQDRCQYFEAHGTGTHAGDPQEASAIYRAFFPPSSPQVADDEKLYVGSIKTVIGHTEGTAGIAGIIKASLCIQNGTIVPNLHFNHPNPEVLPYTSRLSVATNLIPWPELPPGTPRRVSVNSFGFGGTNAHAILESYDPELYRLTNGLSTKSSIPSVLPFVFSAASEQTLATLLENFIQYLEENPKVHLGNLAWSLLHRHSVFPHRFILWAATIDTLKDKIRESLRQRSKDSPLSTTVTRLATGPKQVLGIFTGQGAQWPQMALDLITTSPQTSKWLDDLQASLDLLPEKYRPSFSLQNELMVPAPDSRIAEPIISQTLCTAVQIVQIKLLFTLGISFSSVIGHSSGEIAAAYASGALTESDAIRIAYLRGWVVSNEPGQAGAMMAAGLSLEEAKGICSKAPYKGRVTLAASNSPSSVTLSGDEDAIEELEAQLKGESKFARLLRVNTAYHSHHMGAYSDPYLDALKAANVQPGPLATSTKWYSSVYSGNKMAEPSHRASLAGEYWKDNMVNPVLFSQALTEAVSSEDGLSDLIIEVGPHHALKGPALQTLANLDPPATNIPYIGLFSRGISGIATVAEAIGSFWTYLGPASVKTTDYVALFAPSHTLEVVKGLPTHPFDRQVHWFETRWSKSHWQARHPPHPLLGSLSPDTTEGEWRWRNYLRREELEWLDGHQVQDQTIFPATGYIALAVEASRIVALDLQRNLQLVQVHQLVIDHAISVTDNGTEILCSLDQVDSGDESLSGTFSVFVAEGDNLKKCVTGKVTVSWGEGDAGILPSTSAVAARGGPTAGSMTIDIDEFYQHLAQLGYGYDGPFRSMVSIKRKGDQSSGELANQADSPFVVHPAVMDTGLQALFAAAEAPGDGLLTTLHIPTFIETTTINPNAYGPPGTLVNGTGHAKKSSLFFDASISGFKPGGFGGDIDLFTTDGNLFVQFEGVQVSPLVPVGPANDRLLFSEVTWGPLMPDAKWEYTPPSAEWYERIALPDHIGFWYMKEVSAQLTEQDRQQLDWHRSRIVAWMDHVLALTRAGKHPVCKKEWFEETREDVERLLEKAGGIDAIMGRAVGENLLPFLRDEITMLEVLRKDDILGRFYKNAAEITIMNAHLGDIVKQIAFRFPRMKILEIGGGTGSATNTVLKRIGRSYHSYTFTDISAGFFEEAQTAFAEHDDRFIYKVLDVEQDPEAQGFEEYSYDLIIAANVLHATKSLEQTMHRVRRLLKPGGRLVALEGVNLDIIRITFIICGFEGWWLGEKDGRPFGALVDQNEWERILRKTGFDGFETITPMDDNKAGAYAVFVAQANDDRIRRLREPLAITAVPATNGATKSPDLVVVGGATEKSSSLVSKLKKTLARHFSRVIHASTLEDLASSQELWQSTSPVLLNLADIDEPCFQNLTQDRLDALKTLVIKSQGLLWVSIGSEAGNPHLSMSRGFLNSLRYEQPRSLFQHLNVVDEADADVTLIATTLMRLAHTDIANDYALEECVESIEPDLRFEDGILKVSRIQTGRDTNKRYNANRRAIKDPVDLDRSIVRIDHSAGAWSLVEDRPPQRGANSSRVQLAVTHSTLAAIKIPNAGFLHLVVGRNAQTNDRALALSNQHASTISAPASWSWELPRTGAIAGLDDAALLQTATVAILAQAVLDQAVPGTVLLVHKADSLLQRAIKIQAVARGVRPYFTTSSKSEAAKGAGALFLHRWASNRALAEQIPGGVSATARFDNEDNSLFSRVEALLPDVVRADLGTLVRPSALMSQQYDVHRVATTLQIANGLVSQLVDEANKSIDTIRIVSVPETPPDVLKTALQIVDWTETQNLPVSVQPASSQINLSAQKTYLLVGIANDLGQSVAQWIISRGARHVVLTSRTPKIEQTWVDEMAKLGARVVPLAMDVTDRESILRVDRTIRQQLPPVGGVVNGAMVLTDGLFSELTLEGIHAMFKPKVEGSLFLDELYSDHNLDFFILFGSLVGIIGNWSQSAYSAATNFLTSLVHARRHLRKQVGSVIHPAEVRGVGYVSRQGRALSEHMANTLGTNIVTERDLHELFAEAILAGPPDSGRNPEIIAGMSSAHPGTQPNVIWYGNPRTWDFIQYHTMSTASQTSGAAAVPLKVQLESARDLAEGTGIIREAFVLKLRTKLHLPPEKEIDPETHLAELGVDSLVAVDLRMWFSKELNVDVAVLQILGGASIEEIAGTAASKFDIL